MTAQNIQYQVWLQSLAPKRNERHIQAVSNQFLHSCIQCSAEKDPSLKAAILLLFDDDNTEEEEQERLPSLLEQEGRVIALYTGEKKLPFYRACRLLDMGVEDVLNLQSNTSLGNAIEARLNRWAQIDQILESERVKKTLVGSSPAWQKALRRAVEVARFSTAPVLILGESGTGKELIAKLIHDLDPRRDKQGLVLLDCTTIVPELSGSEFFGHEKGAFTNAVANRDGAFALADRGTLFLDEIGELPLRLQAELLRVSQDGLYKRVGSNMWKQAQFRLVCATHRELLQEVEKGSFRQDLYYRLSTCIVQLPPLRERRLDIPELAEYFLGQNLKTQTPPPIDSLVMSFLMTHPLPGNVRQLGQLLSRISYRHTGDGPVTLGDIPELDRQSNAYSAYQWHENGFKDSIREALANGVGLKDIKRVAGEVAMDTAVEDAKGNLQEAAERLDVSDRLVQGYLAEKKK
ncbi:MAG: sigma 54-interacting transcriptional regulator [Saprospiraceae bacterium]